MGLGSYLQAAYWETSHRCNLNCKFCFATFGSYSLNTNEAKSMIDNIADYGIRTLVFTGGEPFARDDLLTLIRYAHDSGLKTAVETNGLLIGELQLRELDGYLDSMGLPLDGSSSDSQYLMRGNKKLFGQVYALLQALNDTSISSKVNTIVTRLNIEELNGIGRLVEKLDVDIWSVDQFVPLGRGARYQQMYGITQEQYVATSSRLKKLFPDLNIRASTRDKKEGTHFLISPEGIAYKNVDGKNVRLGDMTCSRVADIVDAEKFDLPKHRKRFESRAVI